MARSLGQAAYEAWRESLINQGWPRPAGWSQITPQMRAAFEAAAAEAVNECGRT